MSLRPVEDMAYHPLSDKLVEILQTKTQNSNPLFFRVIVAYYLALVASQMRASIKGWAGRGTIPINVYALALAPSGYGKGHAIGLIEEEVINTFRKVFFEHTFPISAENHCQELALKRAARNGTDVDEELIKLGKDFQSLGSLLFTFDSASTPAIKQMRQKVLMANAGSINLQIDECYTPDVEVLTEHGFQRFDTLVKGIQVAQYDASNNDITFTHPIKYISKDYSGEVYNFVSPTSFDFTVTPNHSMLVWNPTKGYHKVLPHEVNTAHFIPITGKAVDTTNFQITDELRLKIAVQADGCIRPYGTVELSFIKSRKIKELRDLVARLALPHNEYMDSRGYTIFSIKTADAKPYNFSKELRTFMPCINGVGSDVAVRLLDELTKWDGSINTKLPNIRRYTSTSLSNVEYAQELTVLAGYSGKLNNNPKKGYGNCYYVSWNVSKSPMAQLAYLNPKEGRDRAPYRTTSTYTGKVYCVEVPTGNIVLRRNGKVSIGGNCGANFSASIEPLTSYLELYDKGKIKDKLIKSNSDNTRFEVIEGYTPANLMMFGTASKLLDGDRTEDMFYEMLEMGYARRCLFSFTEAITKENPLSVSDLYNDLFNDSQDDWLEDVSDEFGKLADLSLMNKNIQIEKSTVMYLLEYKLDCEQRAEAFTDSQNIQRSEMQHRYFKVLKLAGAYAFVDSLDKITINEIEYAIKLVEDSGATFADLMTPQRPYVKLAKYLANSPEEITLPDLDQDLPYFKGSSAQKDYLIQMATAWGYKNGIVIKKLYSDGVLFLHADAIVETNLDEMIISYTDGDWTEGFAPHKVNFNKLPSLFKQDNHHWLNHHMKHEYRLEANSIKGFNLLVLDVDGGVSLSTAMMLLKDYKAIYYTTKRHTEAENRFRIVLPLNFTLPMDAEDYKKFYTNIIEDLPFEVDEQCGHRSKKWMTNVNTEIHVTDGLLFDALPYIPETIKNEDRQKKNMEQADLDNLERWVINNTGDGNRNNMLLRFCMILMDAGLSYDRIKEKTINLNDKLPDKLSEIEMAKSIFHTLANRMVKAGKDI